MTTDAAATTEDAVAIVLASNRLAATVRKMTNTLFRAGRSGVLNTARDFSCCIVSPRHDLLMAADSLPIHVMSGPELISRALVHHHPELAAGDAFLHNSPYEGNSHAADHCLVVPVVDAGGTHRFTTIVKAHQADCGNALPTTYMSDAIDVYAEGALIFPMVRVQTEYRDRADIIRMCEARIRVPEQWRGDYLAMVGAARIGERDLLTLGEEVGWDTLERQLDGWLDYSERRMVAALRKLTSGRAAAVSVHDAVAAAPDGIPIRSTVTVDASAARVEVDLRDNPDCLPNGLNLSEACARTAAFIGVFNSIDHTVPHNAGSFRRIDVLLRENCVAGVPVHPTSTSVATTNIADRVVNGVQRALAELQDGIGMAEFGSVVAPSAAVVSGRDPRANNRAFVNQIFLMLTSGAGGPAADGWLTSAHAGNGGMLFYDSVEVDERSYPIVVEERSLVPDTEGAGRFRGAPSALVEYGPVDGCDLRVVYFADGADNPALGARGGGPGGPSRQWRRSADGTLTELEALGDLVLAPGERIVCTTTGGGGYGDPRARSIEAVATDVREGWVSAERAAAVYGVALTRSGEVDAEASQELREETS
jgi:N-methylhydantoinase B